MPDVTIGGQTYVPQSEGGGGSKGAQGGKGAGAAKQAKDGGEDGGDGPTDSLMKPPSGGAQAQAAQRLGPPGGVCQNC